MQQFLSRGLDKDHMGRLEPLRLLPLLDAKQNVTNRVGSFYGRGMVDCPALSVDTAPAAGGLSMLENPLWTNVVVRTKHRTLLETSAA